MSSNVPTGLPWTCARSDGFVAALSPPGGNGGAAAPRGVSFAERLEFVRQYEECLLEESSQQAQALARGLQRVVPAGLLRLFTPTEFQRMVCGRPTIDLVLLKRHRNPKLPRTPMPQIAASTRPHLPRRFSLGRRSHDPRRM